MRRWRQTPNCQDDFEKCGEDKCEFTACDDCLTEHGEEHEDFEEDSLVGENIEKEKQE